MIGGKGEREGGKYKRRERRGGEDYHNCHSVCALIWPEPPPSPISAEAGTETEALSNGNPGDFEDLGKKIKG